MNQVRQSSRARQDLIAIWQYIAMDNLAAADHLWAQFEKTYDKLAAHPGIGRHYDATENRMRCYPLGRYLIFYLQENDEGILIYRVLHSARIIADLID